LAGQKPPELGCLKTKTAPTPRSGWGPWRRFRTGADLRDPKNLERIQQMSKSVDENNNGHDPWDDVVISVVKPPPGTPESGVLVPPRIWDDVSEKAAVFWMRLQVLAGEPDIPTPSLQVAVDQGLGELEELAPLVEELREAGWL